MVIPSVLGSVAIVLLVLVPPAFEKARALIILLLGLGSASWLAASAHQKFKSAWITAISGGMMGLLVLAAGGVITLIHVLDVVKEFVPGGH